MKFIAYWDRGKQHANITIDGYTVDEGIVKLERKEDGRPMVVGFFDLGFLDAWYVTEPPKEET
jgi:hypothetical protein